jgi:flagellar hook-associated protein FlgK
MSTLWRWPTSGGGFVRGTTFRTVLQPHSHRHIGTAANDARINYEAQNNFTQELKAAREAVSGVSIEEEAINLVKLQRAYEAAAKVMSTVDQMMETILRLR